MKEPVKALLWDKDGTLVDSLEQWVARDRRLLQMLCRKLDIPEADHAAAVAAGLAAIGVREEGIDPRGEIARGTEASIAAAMAGALSSFGQLPSPEAFASLVGGFIGDILASDKTPAPLRRGIHALLTEAAKRRIIQGLASSDSRKSCLKELSAHGIVTFFTFFAFGDEVPRAKPDPWCVERFSKEIAIPPSQILVIGDAPTDEEMATAAGAQFCALLGGAGAREDFSDRCIVAGHPDEILSLLG